jgi:hypothetical protein
MDAFPGNGTDPRLERAAEELGPRARWAEIKEKLGRVEVIYTDLDGTMMGPRGCFFLNLRMEYTLHPAAVLLEALRLGVDVVPV